MRKLLLAAVLCLAAAVPAGAQGLETKFDARRDAAADVARAVAQAGAEGKNVIVDVGGEWCAWCHILHRFIARQPEVRAAIDADFVWVKVNWSPANKNERLLSAWPKVTGYPHLFVLDRSGRVIRSQPSVELEAGKDYDPAKVLAFLRDSRPAR
jgi:thiol:disulfide interchange protein